uniref:Fe2OG dioxygenase domain-containing protein n=1 Tax=Pseudo-nitzschia australis TaxID=44445 RepID=A0A7S4EK24_9STRA
MVSSSSLPSTKACTLVIGLLLCGCNTVHKAKAIMDTEKASLSKLDIVASIEDDLEYDENGKLAKHYVVFPANRPDCATSLWEDGLKKPKYGFTASPLEGDALSKVFSNRFEGEDYDDKEQEEGYLCMAACLEKGTDRKVAGHTMPHFHYRSRDQNSAKQKTRFKNWFRGHCGKVEVCFVNYVVRERPLEIYWANPTSGDKRKQVDLEFSEPKAYCFHSYLGHEFEAIDDESGFYEKITIEHATIKAFGTSPPSSSQRFDEIKHLEADVKSTLELEWDRHLTVQRTFTSLGFAKGRLPDDVFANMGSFYYNNRNNAFNEEWEGKGPYVNWWDSDVRFVLTPWSMKHRWQLRFNKMVSQWAGTEIEATSTYGFRQYQEGARLLSHVDRTATHAVSLIVNIAQENLASPWPVEIFDHADRLHEVTMEPGDVVYYESAKNLHSRSRPLTCKQGGCQYVNLFTHYRPVNEGDRWHQNLSDVPNRPPPLLEGQVDYDRESSSCSLPEQQQREENNTDNILGIGTVECNDDRLGQYISPTFYKSKSAGDLFRWWKATEDPNFIGFDETDNPNGSHGSLEDHLAKVFDGDDDGNANDEM